MDYGNDDLFDAYLDGALLPPDRAALEARLAQNSDLRRELDLHREARQLIETAALKNALDRIHQRMLQEEAMAQPKSRMLPFRPRLWQAAAAAAIIAIGTATWLLQGSGGNKLYDKYYTQDAGLPGLMGSTSHYTLDDAMVDYKSGEYREAIDKLSALQRQRPGNDTVLYYQAMACLGDHQYRTAQSILQPLTEKENPFRAKASWYAALTDLRLKQKEEARTLLRAIAADSTQIHAADAQALLAEWR